MISSQPPSRRRTATRRLVVIVALFIGVSGLTGCQAVSDLYLGPFTGGLGTPFPVADDPVDCSGSVDGLHEYSTGQASIVFTDGPTVDVALGTFTNGMYVPDLLALDCGDDTQAAWTSDDGVWDLHVGASPTEGGVTTRVDMTIEYLSGGLFYAADASCPASDARVEAGDFSGTARCTGLMWSANEGQSPPPGTAFSKSFDAVISFEARP